MALSLHNSIGIFDFIDKGFLRVNGTSTSPWFNAKDVATILGYVNQQQAIRTHVDEEDRVTLENLASVSQPPLNSQGHSVWINESGLYSLILRSTKPKARKFKRWVTSEVLPTIRKTGAYQPPQKTEKQIDIEWYGQLVHIFKDLGLDDRDALLLKDYARDKFLLENGNHKEMSLSSRQFSVSRRLQETYGLVGKDVERRYIGLGRALASKYRDVYGVDPPKNESFVKGAVRRVNCYFEDYWIEHGDTILERVYDDFFETDDELIEDELTEDDE